MQAPPAFYFDRDYHQESRVQRFKTSFAKVFDKEPQKLRVQNQGLLRRPDRVESTHLGFDNSKVRKMQNPGIQTSTAQRRRRSVTSGRNLDPNGGNDRFPHTNVLSSPSCQPRNSSRPAPRRTLPSQRARTSKSNLIRNLDQPHTPVRNRAQQAKLRHARAKRDRERVLVAFSKQDEGSDDEYATTTERKDRDCVAEMLAPRLAPVQHQPFKLTTGDVDLRVASSRTIEDRLDGFERRMREVEQYIDTLKIPKAPPNFRLTDRLDAMKEEQEHRAQVRKEAEEKVTARRKLLQLGEEKEELEREALLFMQTPKNQTIRTNIAVSSSRKTQQTEPSLCSDESEVNSQSSSRGPETLSDSSQPMPPQLRLLNKHALPRRLGVSPPGPQPNWSPPCPQPSWTPPDITNLPGYLFAQLRTVQPRCKEDTGLVPLALKPWHRCQSPERPKIVAQENQTPASSKLQAADEEDESLLERYKHLSDHSEYYLQQFPQPSSHSIQQHSLPRVGRDAPPPYEVVEIAPPPPQRIQKLASEDEPKVSRIPPVRTSSIAARKPLHPITNIVRRPVPQNNTPSQKHNDVLESVAAKNSTVNSLTDRPSPVKGVSTAHTIQTSALRSAATAIRVSRCAARPTQIDIKSKAGKLRRADDKRRPAPIMGPSQTNLLDASEVIEEVSEEDEELDVDDPEASPSRRLAWEILQGF